MERKKNKAAVNSEPGETGALPPSLPASHGYFLPFHHLRTWTKLAIVKVNSAIFLIDTALSDVLAPGFMG